MPEEGDQIAVEHQSNAGKWILVLAAIVVVAALIVCRPQKLPKRRLHARSA